jgi:hypothetical protein
METTISNVPYYNKTSDEWINNDNYKASGGSKYNYTDNDYIEIIKQSIPNRLNQIPFEDIPLLKEESLAIKKVLEGKIKKLLIGRKTVKFGRPTIHFLGNEIKLDIFPTAPNEEDMFISILFNSYSIIEECLLENKPVYLSITEENN